MVGPFPPSLPSPVTVIVIVSASAVGPVELKVWGRLQEHLVLPLIAA